jgi:hypothetical protein
MPPMSGAATRRMTLPPAPLPHMIGSSPAMIVSTVIIFGRSRSAAPSMMPALRSA